MTCGCNCCEACLKSEIQRGQIEAVRMLDAWIRSGWPRARRWQCDYGNAPTVDGLDWRCALYDAGRLHHVSHGDSPESARANAAESIRSELPDA